MRNTCALLSKEHVMYPGQFLVAVGVKTIYLCEELRYNAQRRRDVPDLASGNLYIDVGDRAARRKRHSFHHELWHMVDYSLNGNDFDVCDQAWGALNPKGFKYGSGGKHMRTDSTSSQLSSAPSSEFLNRYSTSSVAEDKAEIWAALMCYQHVLTSDALRSKARLLQQRAHSVCSEMDEEWWRRVRKTQMERTDYWEQQQVAEAGGKMCWFNYVTAERWWGDMPPVAE